MGSTALTYYVNTLLQMRLKNAPTRERPSLQGQQRGVHALGLSVVGTLT